MTQEFKLKLNPELESIVPPLSKEDDDNLDLSCKEHGQWKGFPLTAAPDGDICDGMNRFKKFLKYHVEIKYVVDETLDTLEKKKMFVIRNVISRRHLNLWQKGLLGLELEKLIPRGSGDKSDVVSSMIPGLGSRSYEKIKSIVSKATPEIKKKLDSGTYSVNTAYQMTRQEERNLPKTDLPEGIIDVLLVDFPTGFERGSTTRGSADNHYDTMTVPEILDWIDEQKAADKIAKNAVGFFWFSTAIQYDTVDVTYHVPVSYDAENKCDIFADVVIPTPSYKAILDKLGFTTVEGEYVWEKDRIGLGTIVRNQHEKCLIAFKGKMPMPLENFSSIIKEAKSEHSRKPEIYHILEKMYPSSKTIPRRYAEWFSRFKGTRKDWVFHGNEIKPVDETNPFQDPEQMKKLEDTFDKSGSKSKEISPEENAKTDKSSWGSQEGPKTIGDGVGTGKPRPIEKPIDRLRNLKK